MALLECNFFSDVLQMSMSMNVILPQKTNNQIGMLNNLTVKKFPCLYLLHGYSDDHTIWVRRTSIERYVSELGIAVIMPNAHKSYYTDMHYGSKYWTYISEELPAIARSFFHISDKRENNFVAGLSMGGYGAFLLALRKPEMFSAAASLSGVLNAAEKVKNPHNPEFKHLLYGEKADITDTNADLFFLAKNISAKDKPSLYQCCGTEDFLYQDNILFKQHIEKLDFNYTYQEEPGAHNWEYWDKKIQEVLKWLPL